jgi:peptide deformylase
MTVKTINTFPDTVLRQKAETVKVFDKDLQRLTEDMIETMRDAPGVGLAAPQIGVSKRVIVIEFGNEDDDTLPKQLYVMVNPEIVSESKEKVVGIEGCLSVPGVVGEVDRAQVVSVVGQGTDGKKIKIRAQGWLARIFQHEIDHVNGILYTDRAENLWQPEPDELDSI